MKLLTQLLFPLLLSAPFWAIPLQTHPKAQPAKGATAACEQEWQAMAQRHRDAADATLKQASGLRSLLTMLRADAGIVRDASARDALQVDADMWESQLAGLQRQASTLHALADQEQSQREVLCGSR